VRNTLDNKFLQNTLNWLKFHSPELTQPPPPNTKVVVAGEDVGIDPHAFQQCIGGQLIT